MTIFVEVRIRPHEVDGIEMPIGDGRRVIVKSHDTYNGVGGLVVICLGDENSVSVDAGELGQAINRCTGLK